ncbi:hypothetical protein OIV19_21760 [Brucella sp. HL-2]|nr:hypothetical protein [Brucella sp. HL-2]MCV9910224.1 hypothetical protein [Brucella sp. HL-2]
MTAENQNLHDMLVAEVAKQTSQEAVRALVEKNIAEIIKRSVDQAFQWGSVKKSIEKSIEDALEIKEPINIPSYSNMMLGLLRGMIDERLSDLINERLANDMEELLGLGTKELTLSGLVKQITDKADQEERRGESITCIVNESDYNAGCYHIYIDAKEDRRNFECELNFYATAEGKISSLSVDGKDAKTRIHVGYMEGWKKQVFALFITGGKFVVDNTDPCTAIGDW